MASESRTLSGHGPTAAVTPPLRIDAAECRAAIAHAPVAIAWLSLDGTIVEANEALAALIGIESDQLPGRRLADFAEDATDVEELLAHVRQGRSGSHVVRCRGQRDSTCTLHCDVSPIKQAGRTAGSRWFFRPDGDRHRASDTSTARDVSEIVHRLRNHLAPISSSLDLLELDGVNPASLRDLRDQLAQLQSEISRLFVSAPASQHADRNEHVRSEDCSGGPSGARTSPSILIVDDNTAIHRALELLLRTLGYGDIRTASTGEAALSQFAERGPSLVFLDIGLPDLDGLAVARRLRALPKGSDAVLVALSGYGQPDDRRAALAAGFDQHLVKPCRLDDLKRVLQHPRLQPASSAAAPPQPAVRANRRTPDVSGPGADASDPPVPIAVRIGQLLREFVHDARTAAFPLQIHQHLLEKSEPPVSADETAGVLREYLAHCDTLLGVLRRAGLVLRDEFDPQFRSVPVQDVIEQAMKEGNRRFAERSIRCIASTAERSVLNADRELLIEALVELLDNAARASSDGASVTIEAARQDGVIAISVCDTGRGIPPDMAACLPQPFQRLDSKPDPLRGQIGVGLAIARRIAELHGGRLTLERRQPQGCHATFELPAGA
jgi:PAS domain S-box-containing protein